MRISLYVPRSGLNPEAINRTGKYRGLFQFDNRSWVYVGGTGDPARASVREQFLRAQKLVQKQGFERAFPQCSKNTPKQSNKCIL